VPQDETAKSRSVVATANGKGVRKILLSGVFCRILAIETILLVWSLGYQVLTQETSLEELFWYTLRIIALIVVIILFMMVTFRRFLDKKIITPLESIAAANRRFNEDRAEEGAIELSADAPREIKEIVSTRSQMLGAILKVSRERLHLVTFIRDTFGRYLSKQIVDEILASPQGAKIGGRRETVTVLMSDLRGFTGLAEDQDPEELVRMLNRYLERMSKVILSYDGIIDEFIGDAILAIFGVPEKRPDDAARAVACALTMQRELAVLNREIVAEGYAPLEMGIGIDTGPVVVGNIGSEMRLKYGIVGTTVNTASRIESQTIGGQVLVGETTHGQVQELATFGTPISVMMKGLKKPIVSYPVVAIGSPFDVTLPPSRQAGGLTTLRLPFQCWVVEDKQVSPRAIAGETLGISEQVILASLEEELVPLTNLKLLFRFCTDVHCFSELYAKVVAVEKAEQRAVLRLGITYITREDRKVLLRWIREGGP
jgi:class 3 adenylate cyclase